MTQSWRKCQSFLYWRLAAYWGGSPGFSSEWTLNPGSQLVISVTWASDFAFELWGTGYVCVCVCVRSPKGIFSQVQVLATWKAEVGVSSEAGVQGPSALWMCLWIAPALQPGQHRETTVSKNKTQIKKWIKGIFFPYIIPFLPALISLAYWSAVAPGIQQVGQLLLFNCMGRY